MLGTTREGSGTTYLKIFDGRVVREWRERPENVDKLMERVNKNDRTVYYVSYEFVSGMLVDCTLDSSEYGETLKLILLDGTERYQLDVAANSKYGTSLFYRMMNIDIEQPVRFMPYSFMGDDGKQKTGLNITQNGEKVDYAYAKEDVPELVVKVRGGKNTYDDTDRYNFFLAELKKFQMKVKAMAVTQGGTMANEPDFPDIMEDDDSDLPF